MVQLQVNEQPCPFMLHIPALCQLPPQGPSSFGLLFDIDGVLVRGRTPIPEAKQCFRNLVDRNGRYKVPVVFVTNAGNCMRQAKAEHLSHLLEVEVNWAHFKSLSACFCLLFVFFNTSHLIWLSQVSPDQVMLSHSPLRIFTQFHKMRVLVSGQGPVVEVAHKYPVLADRHQFCSVIYLFMLHFISV